jgi:hypothetical protein
MLGQVEPSYVIRRFLDAQRINNLTLYLERLHQTNDGAFANADHTTLLLNCYTKLKDVHKLDEFICPDESLGRPAPTFDVLTAISVCRASYPDHALFLARKHAEHSWYMRIQLEDGAADLLRVRDALQYIWSLPFLAVEANLKKYGKTLVDQLPAETTALLKDLCTGEYRPREQVRARSGGSLYNGSLYITALCITALCI